MALLHGNRNPSLFCRFPGGFRQLNNPEPADCGDLNRVSTQNRIYEVLVRARETTWQIVYLDSISPILARELSIP